MIARLLSVEFGAFATESPGRPPDLIYTISGAGPFDLHRQGQAAVRMADCSELLYAIEKDIVVELQRQRADLFFLHSAVLCWRGSASLLVAESGSGKSTTTWAMLHHDCGYLSDELAPIALDAMRVLPYPHALCLKKPVVAYPLPDQTLRLGHTFHVPTDALPAEVVVEACPLDAIFVLRHEPTAVEPAIQPLSGAEAAARLYVNALNALAHPQAGLDAVARISNHARCFALTTAGLPETCALIRSILETRSDRPGD